MLSTFVGYEAAYNKWVSQTNQYSLNQYGQSTQPPFVYPIYGQSSIRLMYHRFTKKVSSQ